MGFFQLKFKFMKLSFFVFVGEIEKKKFPSKKRTLAEEDKVSPVPSKKVIEAGKEVN